MASMAASLHGTSSYASPSLMANSIAILSFAANATNVFVVGFS
jgi:hypothetical protein